MKWFNTLTLDAPLVGVRLRSGPTPREIEQLQRQAEEAAYERGRREGEKVLGQQLLQQRAELLALHQGVFESLRRLVPQIIQEAERTLIELTLASARKIVADLPITPEMVEAVVREATAQVDSSARISVHLHPDDLALLRKHDSSLTRDPAPDNPLRFVASPEVSRGGCLVQTRFGTLDAQRETKFEQLRQSLLA